ncbi:MAG: phage protease [Thermodesulfobacteriota bacterium]
MAKTYRHDIAVAACVGELPAEPPAEIRLIPAGSFRARDGRPHGLPPWWLSRERAMAIIARARAAPGDFVIDYEHQTLHTEKNGQPAPAAGWFKDLEWRDAGLYATGVRWTDAAAARIQAKEYRYISPVFPWDKRTGEVLDVLMAALTNFPGIEGNSDLAALAAAKFITTQEEQVNKEQLAALLGLATDATEEQINRAIVALKAAAQASDTKDAEIAALKTTIATGRPDPEKFVPMETFEALKGEVATLRGSQTAAEVDALVRQGIADGKLLPVQEPWAKELGTKDIAALKGYLDKTPAIAALAGGQTGGKAPEGTDKGALNETELAVCRNMGISPDDYTKANQAA